MESIENIGRTSPVEMTLDASAKTSFRETAKWAKFLSIVGMVSTVLIIIFAVVALVSSSLMNTMYPSLSRFGGGMNIFIGLLYFIIAAIYIYPIVKLYQFSNLSKDALASEDSGLLSQALLAQKSMFKFMGIVTIVVISIYVLLFVFGIFGFIFMDMLQ
ncbi:MAG: hypothetical protein H6567_05250 [Lewinellaceae bacterium]|nr:hypothetical protein [Lewinellaceae bacterium]